LLRRNSLEDTPPRSLTKILVFTLAQFRRYSLEENHRTSQNWIVLQDERHIDNNIFTRIAGGRALTRSEILRKVVIIMSTYEEFMILLTFASLVVAILNLKNKK